jgi:uncharacterized membrane protein (DUF106 family)
VCEAIEESNRLRLKFDTLQQQRNETMGEDKEMSKDKSRVFTSQTFKIFVFFFQNYFQTTYFNFQISNQ